jgi:hypothetical protein
MGFGTAFLSLCLAVSVQADRWTLSDGVKTLSGATADGSAVTINSMDLDYYTPLPTPNWYVRAWVQIKPATADTARLLQFKGFNGAVPVECYVTWKSTAPPTFTFGATDHSVAGYTNSRQENVWFHLLLGSISETSFGYITFRAASNNQYSVTWTESILAKRESTLMAPVNANPFNVSSK